MRSDVRRYEFDCGILELMDHGLFTNKTGDKVNTSWHSYPKIWALGHRAVRDLFHGVVLCEEKVDGSQFSFGRFGGELKCKSKRADIDPENPEKMFSEGVEFVKTLDLNDGWTYRVEYLKKPKHNALAYDRVPKGHIIIFDINTAEEEYLGYHEKKREAERLGLEVVPVLYIGLISDITAFIELLKRPSILGGQTIEGVVVKNYALFGEDKKVLMGKFVSDAFKEVHRKSWKESNPSKNDIVQSIILSLKTESRWMKAVQHLSERGELTESMKDIGPLIKEVQQDTLEECKDDIVSALFEFALPHIRRGIVGGLPEWYKSKLLDIQFSGLSTAGVESNPMETL